MTPVAALVANLVRRRGPIPFDEVMDLALYHPEHGFYATAGSGAGRRGDFITSPEVGPLFGAVVARALDEWWHDSGEPDPYLVVDAGAGPGTLARTVLAAQPACAPALRYVLVDRSAAQRARHAEWLPSVDPAQALAPRRSGPDGETFGETGDGPVVVSLPEMPRLDVHVVIANELLDNLPVGLREGDAEIRVGLADDDETLVEVRVPSTSPTTTTTEPAPREPVQAAAADWLATALGIAGRVVVFDYAVDTTDELRARPWREWLRTYRSHGRGGSPLDDLGEQDITCEVAIDQLARVRAPTVRTTQAEWLRAHGVDDLVEEGRRVWDERAAIGDLTALRARSRITEAAALTDPTGLGAFRVLEW